MVLIKISKRTAKIIIMAVVLLSLSMNVYSAFRNTKLEARYNALSYVTNHFDIDRMDAFEVSADKAEYDTREIEIFDIKKGQVIKKVKNSDSIQCETEKLLRGITGYNPKIKAIPDNGYIIRIPMKVIDTVKFDLVYLIITAKDKPYILVLDKNMRPFLYNFDGEINKLLEIIDFVPKF